MEVEHGVMMRRAGLFLGLLVSVGLLAGCSTDTPIVPGRQGSTSGERSGAPGTSDQKKAEAANVAPSDKEWDPESWVPTVEIQPLTFTDAEGKEYRKKWLARFVKESDLSNPPDVKLVAWMSTRREQAKLVASCLQEEGFPSAKPGVNGGIIYEPGVPESQEPANNLATYVCYGKYPLDPTYAQEWSEDQIGLVYDYWDQYFIPCMQAHGHPIATTNEPTREAYIAAFNTPERIDWWPNGAFLEMPANEQGALIDVCPPYPPDKAMYGQSG